MELQSLVKDFGITLSENEIEQFNTFYNLLIDWNSKVNLTAITDYEEVLVKHFVDSLSIIKAIDINSVESIIDVGTGGGFPGIPLAIVFPDIKITLLDSLNKRINFLNIVIDTLGLTNVNTIHGRAEDFSKKELRESFDLCVSRAVANLSTLSELCIPFVKVGGLFVSYKSEKASIEINEAKNALSVLNSEVVSNCNFVLPGSDFERNLLVIKKNGKTPNKYPRKAGTPAKQPL